MTNYVQSFTFQALTVCLVVSHFRTMKCWWLCCEIDNVFGGSIPACFVHVLSTGQTVNVWKVKLRAKFVLLQGWMQMVV